MGENMRIQKCYKKMHVREYLVSRQLMVLVQEARKEANELLHIGYIAPSNSSYTHFLAPVITEL